MNALFVIVYFLFSFVVCEVHYVANKAIIIIIIIIIIIRQYFFSTGLFTTCMLWSSLLAPSTTLFGCAIVDVVQ